MGKVCKVRINHISEDLLSARNQLNYTAHLHQVSNKSGFLDKKQLATPADFRESLNSSREVYRVPLFRKDFFCFIIITFITHTYACRLYLNCMDFCAVAVVL